MNKSYLWLFFLIILIPIPVHAAVDSIYDYIKKIDNQYAVVVGLNGKSGDSFAATDVVIGLQRQLHVDLEPTIESLINPNVNKILIGHPCGNSLIHMTCEEWPYENGEAIIKIDEGDLIIAGTTVDDTQRAAKVVANFKAYPLLKEEKEVLVISFSGDIDDATLLPLKKKYQFVCGDGACDTGEKYLCPIDCEQKSCFLLCQEKGFDTASCRLIPTSSATASCPQGEESQGLGYCADDRNCCCANEEKQEANNASSGQTQTPSEKEKLSIFRAILAWLRELFSTIF